MVQCSLPLFPNPSFDFHFYSTFLQYLFTLSLDKTLQSLKGMWRDSVLKRDLGKNHVSCPLAFGSPSNYLLGSFLQSINRELEGGRAFDFPSDLKLSAPPAHHLQDRSSECNRPFILMTLFYWCRNWGPWKGSNVSKAIEWVSIVPTQRPHSQLSRSFF